MFAKKTKTTEMYILPEEFEAYTDKGYIIFMTRPTIFGTYRAVKIELVENVEEIKKPARYKTGPTKPTTNPLVKFWSQFHQQYLSI